MSTGLSYDWVQKPDLRPISYNLSRKLHDTYTNPQFPPTNVFNIPAIKTLSGKKKKQQKFYLVKIAVRSISNTVLVIYIGGEKMSAKVSAARTRVGKYEMGRTLGEGSFAKVKFAKNVETGEFVAIKIVDRDHVRRHKMVEQVCVTYGYWYPNDELEWLTHRIILILSIFQMRSNRLI